MSESNGEVVSDVIYVRITSTSVTGSVGGDVTISGGGASTQTVAVSGTVTAVLSGERCTHAQDLSLEVSPLNTTTVGYADDISTCKTGAPDRVFYYDIPDGGSINIGQSSNAYDSYHL